MDASVRRDAIWLLKQEHTSIFASLFHQFGGGKRHKSRGDFFGLIGLELGSISFLSMSALASSDLR